MPSPRQCGCGAGFLPHRDSQRFCSRRCAAQSRSRRERRPRREADDRHHKLLLRLLDIQPLERRARGGWRFGTRRIGESVVAKLIASGRAEIRGDRLHPKQMETT